MPPHMVLEELVVGGVERGQLHAGASLAVFAGTASVPTDLRRHVLPRRASRRKLLYALAATGIYWPARIYFVCIGKSRIPWPIGATAGAKGPLRMLER